MKLFKQAWLEAVEKKDSILCAGIDPAECMMGRTDKGGGLPAGTNKRDWVLSYIEAVAPYAAAFKPNIRYMGAENDNALLMEMGALAEEKGMVFIQDSKEADIGETNDSGIFRAAWRGAHAVTLSPFAGNMEEAAKQGRDREIGLISMCLMSNPQYAKVKNRWVDVSDDVSNYDSGEIRDIDGIPHTRFYMQLARDANRFGIEGIVLGAPSKSNHITEQEVGNVAHYYGKQGLILVPGIGAQGGEISMLLKYFNVNSLIANVGRGLMFPDPRKAYATHQEQAEAAKQYRNMLSSLRKTA